MLAINELDLSESELWEHGDPVMSEGRTSS
jgi:hypothetical protein